jgi:predicted glycosyltransferase
MQSRICKEYLLFYNSSYYIISKNDFKTDEDSFRSLGVQEYGYCHAIPTAHYVKAISSMANATLRYQEFRNS